MEDARDSEELEYPKTLADLTSFVDGLSPTRDVLVRTRLGHAKRSAEAAEDVALVNAITAEGNAFLFFGDTDSLAAAIIQIRTYFNDEMIEYLRGRRDATSEPRLRARYAHVIAAYTNRHDEGLRAVDAYVAAVDHYRDVERNVAREGLRALHTLVPLGSTRSRAAIGRGIACYRASWRPYGPRTPICARRSSNSLSTTAR